MKPTCQIWPKFYNSLTNIGTHIIYILSTNITTIALASRFLTSLLKKIQGGLHGMISHSLPLSLHSGWPPEAGHFCRSHLVSRCTLQKGPRHSRALHAISQTVGAPPSPPDPSQPPGLHSHWNSNNSPGKTKPQ